INAHQALQDQPAPRRIRLASSYDPAASRILITVEDNGPGIPERLRARVFEPYFTTKPTGTGTGVGLAVSFGIVDAHGGTLTVDCAVAGGSVFSVPRPAAPADALGVDAGPCRETRASQRTILVVDDEADVRETLAEILTGAQHRVVSASSASEALERMAAEHF